MQSIPATDSGSVKSGGTQPDPEYATDSDSKYSSPPHADDDGTSSKSSVAGGGNFGPPAELLQRLSTRFSVPASTLISRKSGSTAAGSNYSRAGVGTTTAMLVHPSGLTPASLNNNRPQTRTPSPTTGTESNTEFDPGVLKGFGQRHADVMQAIDLRNESDSLMASLHQTIDNIGKPKHQKPEGTLHDLRLPAAPHPAWGNATEGHPGSFPSLQSSSARSSVESTVGGHGGHGSGHGGVPQQVGGKPTPKKSGQQKAAAAEHILKREKHIATTEPVEKRKRNTGPALGLRAFEGTSERYFRARFGQSVHPETHACLPYQEFRVNPTPFIAEEDEGGAQRQRNKMGNYHQRYFVHDDEGPPERGEPIGHYLRPKSGRYGAVIYPPGSEGKRIDWLSEGEAERYDVQNYFRREDAGRDGVGVGHDVGGGGDKRVEFGVADNRVGNHHKKAHGDQHGGHPHHANVWSNKAPMGGRQWVTPLFSRMAWVDGVTGMDGEAKQNAEAGQNNGEMKSEKKEEKRVRVV